MNINPYRGYVSAAFTAYLLAVREGSAALTTNDHSAFRQQLNGIYHLTRNLGDSSDSVAWHASASARKAILSNPEIVPLHADHVGIQRRLKFGNRSCVIAFLQCDIAQMHVRSGPIRRFRQSLVEELFGC